MQIAEEQRKPGWLSLPRQAMRFVFYWLIKLLVLAVLFGWRRKPFVAAALVIGIFLWWLGSAGPLSPNAFLESGSVGNPIEQFSSSVALMPPAPAAEQYLKGQSRYDAKTMWDAVSDEMKRSTTARSGGLTLQRLEQQLDDARKNGVQFDRASYIGGFAGPSGRTLYFYVVVVTSSSETRYVPYAFTINQEGKILSID